MLPLLQSVPLHIENARNQVKDSISELRRHISSGQPSAVDVLLTRQQSAKRTYTGASDSAEPVAIIGRKRRRVDDLSTGFLSRPCSVTPEHIHPSPASSVISRSRQSQSPEVPHSAVVSSVARSTTLQTPLAELKVSDQPSPAKAFQKPRIAPNRPHPTTAQVGASASSPVLLRATPRLSASISSTAHTPSRASGARLHIHAPAKPHASTPPVPAGGRHLPITASTHITPQQTRKGSYRPPLLPIALPITPVQDRLLRSGTLRSSSVFSSNVQSDMRPPSVPPSSTGKPMSLKNRRALLLDDHMVSSQLCYRSRDGELTWNMRYSEVRAKGSFLSMMTTTKSSWCSSTKLPPVMFLVSRRIVNFLLRTQCGV